MVVIVIIREVGGIVIDILGGFFDFMVCRVVVVSIWEMVMFIV